MTWVLSTYARHDNKCRRRKTAVLRRQSDDSSRIDRDAFGRFGGDRKTQFADCVRNVELHITFGELHRRNADGESSSDL